MTLRFLLFVLPIMALGLHSCGSKKEAKTSKDIGPQVMQLLNEMGDITKPEFSKFFITSEELKELAESDVIDITEQQQIVMKTITKESMKDRYNFMFRRLKSKGRRVGVNWERAKFVSFKHETVDQGGIKICNGVLKFKYSNREFVVETSSVFDGDIYLLTSVEGLRQVTD